MSFFVCTHQPQLHIEITCSVEFFGPATTSFPQHLSDTRNECFMHGVVDGLLHDALGDSLLQVCHHAHERVRWCKPPRPEFHHPAEAPSEPILGSGSLSASFLAERRCETIVPSCDFCANGKFEKLRLCVVCGVW